MAILGFQEGLKYSGADQRETCQDEMNSLNRLLKVVLQALEVQELTSIDEDGDPVLHKISQDSAVVISGEIDFSGLNFNPLNRYYIAIRLPKTAVKAL